MTRPPIALTCGDPAGVGPELSIKAHQTLGARLPFFWIGDPAHLPDGTAHEEIHDPMDAVHVSATALPVLRHPFPVPAQPGQPDLRNAPAVMTAITRAVELVQEGRASAVCTNPIHKQVLQDGAGFAYPGHTEFLASLAGVKNVVMMLACDELRVVPVTIHIAVKDVAGALTEELLEQTLRITHDALIRDFGVETPRLAVAGLNPHAGEGGKMGTEEITLITPVVERLNRDGLHISGPRSADTMFHAQARAGYDAAICMYHDQALIPIKTIDFSGGVNVTLGLPFIRTSPDHGTAFDIAGSGRADPTSLIAALNMADTMAKARTT